MGIGVAINILSLAGQFSDLLTTKSERFCLYIRHSGFFPWASG
jgi:hypothetical protein